MQQNQFKAGALDGVFSASACPYLKHDPVFPSKHSSKSLISKLVAVLVCKVESSTTIVYINWWSSAGIN